MQPLGITPRSAAGIAISSRVYSANDPETIQEITIRRAEWVTQVYLPWNGKTAQQKQRMFCGRQRYRFRVL
jgi:hypothetical protein